jgi:hypothetical protein
MRVKILQKRRHLILIHVTNCKIIVDRQLEDINYFTMNIQPRTSLYAHTLIINSLKNRVR